MDSPPKWMVQVDFGEFLTGVTPSNFVDLKQMNDLNEIYDWESQHLKSLVIRYF